MESINSLMNNYGAIINLVTSGITLILLIIVIIQGNKLKNIKNKYNKAFKDVKVDNLDDLLGRFNREIDNIKITNKEIINDINRIHLAVNNSYSKMSILNYDAFNDRTGQLSFVFALLDRYNSGIVINGIYSNDGHYLYLKKIKKGTYQKELTKEENKVLTDAMNMKEQG